MDTVNTTILSNNIKQKTEERVMLSYYMIKIPLILRIKLCYLLMLNFQQIIFRYGNICSNRMHFEELMEFFCSVHINTFLLTYKKLKKQFRGGILGMNLQRYEHGLVVRIIACDVSIVIRSPIASST